MTNEERVAKLQKQLKDFKIVVAPASLDISHSLGKSLSKDFGSGDLISQVSQIESALKSLRIIGGQGSQVEGAFDTGYSVTCPPPSQAPAAEPQPPPCPSCCNLSLVSGITFVTLGLDLVSECCLCSPDCESYERSTGRTWNVTTSDPPEVDHFLFKCYDIGGGCLVLDFSATSHDSISNQDVTGRGVVVTVNDSDIYYVNADIGYLSYPPFPPDCGRIAVAPYATIATFDGCDDTAVVTYPPEIGATYSPAELVGTHTFTQDVECTHHPGKFWHATWSITFG